VRAWVVGFFLGAGSLAIAQQAPAAPQKTAGGTSSIAKDARLLVIQAEDLGMAHSIDKASFEALEKGWVTTANVMVPGPWFPEVVRWSRNHPNADLGIELDLNSDWTSYRWRPVSNLSSSSGLTDTGGYLSSSDRSVAQHGVPAEAESEVRAQIEMAKHVGVPITHLDNHMHTMLLTPPLFQVYWKMGQEFGLPVVISNQLVKMRGTPTQTSNSYSFGGIDLDLKSVPVDSVLEIKPGFAKQDWLTAYENALANLPPGVYLLSVHLGYNDEELQAMTWDHPYWGAEWRQNDLDVVSNPDFQKFLKDKGFILVGWKDLKKAIADHP
jgi:predicted glycoside hydrolase/deacetylase ChbG (UPF0249 family)